MNINLHNYEEFFILYMDNELSSEDRRSVEAFLEKHPDLKEDLDILMQYKLVPDSEIVFPGKEDLLKQHAANGEEIILTSNIQEQLLLYIDNELPASERIALEQYLAAHPAAGTELALLEKARLQPEIISFPNKESLYRREEPAHRIIAIRWWRIAAAAILVLALGLVLLLRKSKQAPELVNAPVQKQKLTPVQKQPVEKESPKQTIIPALSDKADNEIAQAPQKKETKAQGRHKLALPGEQKPANRILVPQEEKEQPVLAENKPSNNLPQRITDPNNEVNPEGTVAGRGHLTPEETSPTIVTPAATQTSYTDTKSITNEDLSQSSRKRSKLRGFFRKLTRTFEKTTKIDPTDENKVLIGGLAFKLK